MADQAPTKFSKTKPLYVVLAAWFLSPMLAFLRYGYAKLALGYLFALAVCFSIAIYVLYTFHMGYPLILAPFFVFLIVGVVHLYRLLKANSFEYERRWYSHWAIISVLLVLSVTSLYSVRLFFYRPFIVNSGSMLPTLKFGEYYFADLRAYATKDPQRGDIVVFRFNESVYTKRIVGLPGDKVRILDGRLILNGSVVPITPLPDFQYKDRSNFELTVLQFQETPPDGRSYAIIDTVDNSAFDNTPEYSVPEEHYFVLGDNRDNSADSRADVGFVHRSALFGKIID